jgi:hypothetical protein
MRSGSATSTATATPRALGVRRFGPENWSPDEHYFFGDVETNLLNSDGVILHASPNCQGS